MANMTELIPVVIVSMILAVLSHWKSTYSYSLDSYIVKDRLFYAVMTVIMILFVGLRTRYNDTKTYLYGYEMMDITGSILDGVEDWSIGANPGFILINSFLRHRGISSQSFLMIFAAITNGIYLWFLRKYTNNIWQTIFLFIVLGCYTFTLAAVKQCVAVAFCLLAVDQALQKHYLRFFSWVLVATLFHPYSLMFLIVPFLMFRPWSWKTFLMLTAFGLAGILLRPMIGTIIDITTMLGEGYDADSFSGEGVNPFRLAVCAVPLILSFLSRRNISQMDSDQDKKYYLFTNLSMLNAEIMFVALFGTANYFARLANYFLIFQTLSIPWIFRFFEKKSRQLLICTAIVCYCFYFIYENAIDKNFNHDYDSISVMNYLLSLF